MISAGRILGLAAAGAVLLGLSTAETPASAQQSCKGERVTGKSQIRAFRNAETEARKNWQKVAEDRFGASYNNWESAKDAKIECEDTKSPTLGMKAKVCTASGFPCTRGETTAGDRSRRDRDPERSVREERRFKTAFDAEMRHQEWLAKFRRRAEERAQRREEAFYRRLYYRWSNGPWYDYD